MTQKRYEQIPHTADLAAKIYGKTLPELYQNAAFAMFDMMADVKDAGAEEPIEVSVEAPDRESLLISWLNELLYIFYIKRIVFSEFSISSLTENKLTGTAKGQKIKEGTNPLKAEIKAATYHDLDIRKTENGYEVTVIFDV
jgi:SHS2 domain-containing protein